MTIEVRGGGESATLMLYMAKAAEDEEWDEGLLRFEAHEALGYAQPGDVVYRTAWRCAGREAAPQHPAVRPDPGRAPCVRGGGVRLYCVAGDAEGALYMDVRQAMKAAGEGDRVEELRFEMESASQLMRVPEPSGWAA